MPVFLRPVFDRATWKRWAYLVAGGALLLPYWFLAWIVVGALGTVDAQDPVAVLFGLFLAFGLPVLATLVTGLVGTVRVLEAAAVNELVGRRLGDRPIGPPGDWPTRIRAACWFTLHLHVGVVVSGLSLGIPAGAIALLVIPFGGWGALWIGWLAPAAALVLMAVLIGVIVLAGLAMDRIAPVLLGPSAAERMAELESRASRLAERNRLARELHDSVGHALSVVTLQAAAAGRVLDSDPDFAKQALGAIEESARSALEDLDHVLGLLREEGSAKAPQPTLAELDGLLEKTRLAGVQLDASIGDGLGQVPAVVSREAYRIVQEGLTNALRHAGKVPVRLSIGLREGRLELALSNPMPAPAPPARRSGGRGLYGIRERVTVLRGEMHAGPDGGRWRMDVSLPLGPMGRRM